MTYDTWKTTNPDDRFLGEEPMDDEEKAAMAKRYTEMVIAIKYAEEMFRDGELTLAGLARLGDVYENAGYHPYQIRQLLSRYVQYPIPKGYFGREE